MRPHCHLHRQPTARSAVHYLGRNDGLPSAVSGTTASGGARQRPRHRRHRGHTRARPGGTDTAGFFASVKPVATLSSLADMQRPQLAHRMRGVANSYITVGM